MALRVAAADGSTADTFWVESSPSDPHAFQFLYSHFKALSQEMHVDEAELDGKPGYLVRGITRVDGDEAIGDNIASVQLALDSTSMRDSISKSHRRLNTVNSVSLLTVCSNRIRKLSQISDSSDRVRLRLAGDRSPSISNSVGSFDRQPKLDLVEFRFSKASDDIHFYAPSEHRQQDSSPAYHPFAQSSSRSPVPFTENEHVDNDSDDPKRMSVASIVDILINPGG